jgi:hypothetical protein
LVLLIALQQIIVRADWLKIAHEARENYMKETLSFNRASTQLIPLILTDEETLTGTLKRSKTAHLLENKTPSSSESSFSERRGVPACVGAVPTPDFEMSTFHYPTITIKKKAVPNAGAAGGRGPPSTPTNSV